MTDPKSTEAISGPVFAVGQHQGRRPYQEDQIGYQDNGDVELNPPSVIALADGMGGHVGGREAATLAVSAYLDNAASSGADSIRNRQLKALEAANQAIRDKIDAEPDFEGMGCTLIGLSVVDGKIRWISVGDSPLWLVDGNAILRLNADHSMAGAYRDMVAAGEMTPEEAQNAPNQNALRSALSGGSVDMIDCPDDWIQLPSGSVLIAASDGLDTLKPDEILKIVRDGPRDAKALVQILLDEVLKRDRPKQDNVTVAVLLAAETSNARTATERTTLVKGTSKSPAPAPDPAQTHPEKSGVLTPRTIAIIAAAVLSLLLLTGALLNSVFSDDAAPEPRTEDTDINVDMPSETMSDPTSPNLEGIDLDPEFEATPAPTNETPEEIDAVEPDGEDIVEPETLNELDSDGIDPGAEQPPVETTEQDTRPEIPAPVSPEPTETPE